MWVGIVVALLAGIALVGGILWWQERPLSQAEQALSEGEPKYALFLVDQFLAGRPDHSRALVLKARAHAALGEPDEALRIFEAVGAASADEVHAWARAYLLKQQWSQAVPLLQRAAELTPDDPDVLYELTSARVRLGLLEEALESAGAFAELPDQKARGLLFVGTIHHDLGNDQKAAEAFARVLQLEPDGKNLQVAPYDFFLQYARILTATGDDKQARSLAERSRALEATADAAVLLGDLAARRNDLDQARQRWQEALERDAANRRAREALANAALQDGDAEAAWKWLQPLARDPALQASTAYLFQRTATKLGREDAEQWQKRTDQLRKRAKIDAAIDNVLKESPYSFWARVIRAYRFAYDGNWQQAGLVIGPLVEEAPEDPFVAELAKAIERRGSLPSLEQLPIQQF